MSGWITFALVILVIFGQPMASEHRWKSIEWIAWAAGVIAMTFALLIDARGWPL